MAIHPGYMGTCEIVGITPFRFESASITAKQAFETPDMVMGHWDRGAYHPGKIDISGSISGPATEGFVSGGASSLFGWAVRRGDCGQLTSRNLNLIYYCDGGSGIGGGGGQQARSFTSVFANSVNFSCSAGDNAQFSVDVMSMDMPEWITLAPTLNETTEKVITWDNTNVTITSGSGVVVPVDALLSSFEFSINNNCAPYYSLTASRGYLPTAIIAGLRSVTGSLTAYDPQAFDGVFGFNSVESYPGTPWDAEDARATLEFNIGGSTFKFFVMFHRNEPTLTVGPIMSTIAFTGTGIQTDLNLI